MPGVNDARPDIERARGRMRRRSKVKRELLELAGQVATGETVLCLAVGQRHSRVGLLALTDQRVFWSLIGPLRLAVEFEEFPLSRIDAVRWETGTFGGTVTIATGTRPVEITGVQNADGERFAEQASAALTS